MSGINIQNVLDKLSTLASAADSSQSVTYLSDLSNAVLQANNLTGVIEYPSKKELPIPVDSSALGRVYYVPPRADLTYTDSGGYDSAGGVDNYGAFYYAKQLSDLDSGYTRIRTTKDDGSSSGGSPFQGSVSGYKSGGSGPTTYNTIVKWSFSSDGNASDVGDQTTARYDTGGHSSSSHGYTSGGYGYYNIIDNFPFASGGNASDVGDLTVARTTVGHSSSESGYSSGGAPNKNVIDKFPFAANGNATDVGDLLGNSWYNAGISSGSDGYNAGGAVPSVSNVIQKFSFSADGNSTDVGDLTVARERPTGTNSDTHGYAAGGHPFSSGAATALTIDKFSFSSGGNATDVGDITNRGSGGTGQSSTASGYIAGGYGYGSPNYKNIIEKYSFSSDGNATDVGDLTVARYGGAGQQY